MATWEKVDETHYVLKTENPKEIIDINKMKEEYKALQNAIKETIVEIPEGISEKAKKALETYNEEATASFMFQMENIAEQYREITGKEIWQ